MHKIAQPVSRWQKILTWSVASLAVVGGALCGAILAETWQAVDGFRTEFSERIAHSTDPVVIAAAQAALEDTQGTMYLILVGMMLIATSNLVAGFVLMRKARRPRHG
jgi:ABC-type lipoprotein release transport system permease subunit